MVAKVRRERKESSCLAVSCSIFARTNHLHWQGPVPGKNSLKFCCHRPRYGFLTRSASGATARASVRWIEGCKRQATDLLARDFYSLSLPTPGRYGRLRRRKRLVELRRCRKLFCCSGRNSGKTRLVCGGIRIIRKFPLSEESVARCSSFCNIWTLIRTW